MNKLVQDIRYALRQLRKAPGFSLTAVLTLALGIGATATMYTVVRGVLLAPLPYQQVERLVGVGFTFPQEKPNAEEAGSSAQFLAEHSRSFESVGVSEDGSSGANLSGTSDGGHALQITSLKVSRGYFPTLGVAPILGRGFTVEDDLPGGPKVALLSERLWKRAFNGDTGILNRAIRINEEAFTVVGVMPSTVGHDSGGATDVWQPLQLSQKDPGYGGDNYQMVARLRSGVSLVQAQQEMDALKRPFYQQFPNYLSWTSQGNLVHEFRVWPLQEVVVSDVRTSVLTMMAAVGAVLLMACLNLAGLMVVRASRRMREIALRTALGASRGSLLRLMLCESALLAVIGGGLGLALAYVATPLLLEASPMAVPQIQANGFSWAIAGFVLLLICVTTMVFGLAPALLVFRQDARLALQGTSSASARQTRTGKGLIVGQIAVAMVLLSAASLLLGSFLKLRSIHSGVEASHLAVAQVTLRGSAYKNTLHTTQFVDKVVAELGRYPGVERVAAVNGLPLDRGLNMGARPADRPEMKQTVEFRAVTPGYFRTLGISVMSGRDITEADAVGKEPVALVSETAARRWWPGRSPIGEQVVTGGEVSRRIVGVVADTRSHSLAEAPRVVIYAPFAQLSDSMTGIINGWFPTTFAVRVSGNLDIGEAVERAVADADEEIPVARVESMQAVIDHTTAAPQFYSWLAGGFAVFALLLTVIGLFGLLSYQVTQRTREIGVRLAVGANRSQIVVLILRHGFVLTAVGLVLGAMMSAAVPRLVGNLLVDNIYTGGADIGSAMSNSVATLIVAAVAMVIAAMAASYLPARRAASIEPTRALRAE
jgi:putative ABC transport system permease protein